MARSTPAALAASTARSTAATAPEMTTWPPPLSLATSTTSRSPVSGSGAASAQTARARPPRARPRGHRAGDDALAAAVVVGDLHHLALARLGVGRGFGADGPGPLH